jgi:hypothetical protein
MGTEGTLQNLAALTEKVRSTRERLQAAADRVAALQRRLRTDAPTIVSLDQLSQRAQASMQSTAGTEAGPKSVTERFEGELAQSDAWEISLINEEG